MSAPDRTASAPHRILHVDTSNGVSLKLLVEAVRRLLHAESERGEVEKSGTAPVRPSPFGDALERFVSLGQRLLSPEAYRTLVAGKGEEERVRFLLSAFDTLGVTVVRCPALPVGPAGAGEDPSLASARSQALEGFTVDVNTRGAGTGLGAALFARALPVVQGSGSSGRLVARAGLRGKEGTSFEVWLLEDAPGDDGEASPENTQGNAPEGSWEHVVQLETHIDHLTGEEMGLAMDALMAAPGVVDVLCLGGLGKKNRPMQLLRVICRQGTEDRVARAFVRHTHTLGFRRQVLDRFALPRGRGEAALSDGSRVPSKDYAVDGVLFRRPECDAVAARAKETGQGAPSLRFQRGDAGEIRTLSVPGHERRAADEPSPS